MLWYLAGWSEEGGEDFDSAHRNKFGAWVLEKYWDLKIVVRINK